MKRTESDHDAHDMYANALRLACQLGLTPAEQGLAAAVGLRTAQEAAARLEHHAQETGAHSRPLVLLAALAIALSAVTDDEEFTGHPPG